MNLRNPILQIASLILIFSCTTHETYEWETGNWIDLTYDFSEETLYWPTSSTFKKDTVFVGITEGGFYYESFEICTAEHGGTHLDAPIHFYEDRKTVDQIEITQLTGRAAVIDVSEQVSGNRDYQVTVADITNWETAHGMIPENAILLFHTGMGAYWPDPLQYLGTDKRGEEGVAELSFPGIHPDTAQWLIENRRINAVGLDTPSLDYGKSRLFETHVILFEQNIPGFENVANLHLLPPVGAYVIALPMKINNGSGAPLRIVAHVRD
ncbi:MAG: cyclase family protein [Balneolaceae bacterium]|nr:MAG: cyclase family protein [Balneolaceae bacterium]